MGNSLDDSPGVNFLLNLISSSDFVSKSLMYQDILAQWGVSRRRRGIRLTNTFMNKCIDFTIICGVIIRGLNTHKQPQSIHKC